MSTRMSSYSFSQMYDLIDLFQSKEPSVMSASNSWIIIRFYYQESKFRSTKWAELIRESTIISRDHITPEIQLHLITPACHLWSANEVESPFNDPFWAFYWPGGQALSRYILDNSSIVKDKSVLDFGCGSGACAIAAAMSKAKTIVANDIDEVACIATELNADINNVRVETNSSNLMGQLIPWDCILVGDMFYNEDFASQLFKWLRLVHNSGKLILIGDAGRLALKNLCKRENLKSIASVQLPPNLIFENGFSSAEIWSL